MTPRKPGRPKLSPSEKRTAVVFVYFTPGEKREFLRMCKPTPYAYVAREILLRWMGEKRRRSE